MTTTDIAYTAPPPLRPASFEHEAALHRSPAELAAASASFVREGLERGEAVLVALGGSSGSSLGRLLGPDARSVDRLDGRRVGRNPGRLLSVLWDFVEACGDRPLRALVEVVWPGRSDDELVECELHEHLANHAFADCAGFRLRCVLDTSTVPRHVVSANRTCHRRIHEGGRVAESREFAVRPRDELLAAPLAEVPSSARWMGFDDGRRIDRSALARAGRRHGLDDGRLADYVLVVSELLDNAHRHGGGLAGLAVWRDGDRLCTEVRSPGRLHDPMVGRRRASFDDVDGRGLWVAHQLADLVQLRSGPSGCVARVGFDLRP